MRMAIHRVAFLVALLAVGGLTILAQGQTERLAFDVVSIKQAPPSEPAVQLMTRQPSIACGNRAFVMRGNRVMVPVATVCGLVALAYDLRSDQIVGPDWIREAKAGSFYTMDARGPEGTTLTLPLAREMFRTMLAERLNLRVRRGEAEMNVYNLVVAKGGARLDQPDPKLCPAGSMLANGPTMQARCAPPASMKEIASDLGAHLDRPVIDKTGLDGTHIYSLEWSAASAVNPSLPGVFTAIEEQIGLRLEPAKAALQVLVVEQVERPSPD
jgi:uncharacterized protein (TIGR03435 family)